MPFSERNPLLGGKRNKNLLHNRIRTVNTPSTPAPLRANSSVMNYNPQARKLRRKGMLCSQPKAASFACREAPHYKSISIRWRGIMMEQNYNIDTRTKRASGKECSLEWYQRGEERETPAPFTLHAGARVKRKEAAKWKATTSASIGIRPSIEPPSEWKLIFHRYAGGGRMCLVNSCAVPPLVVENFPFSNI